jgi:hypothetical protein
MAFMWAVMRLARSLEKEPGSWYVTPTKVMNLFGKD